jgi:hypothetical protein
VRSGIRTLQGGISGAGDRIRTGDIDLGKVALYQLSYSRSKEDSIFLHPHRHCQTSHASERILGAYILVRKL